MSNDTTLIALAGSSGKAVLVTQNSYRQIEKIYGKLISELESHLSTECAWVH